MECKNLYRVQEKDLDRLREILTICFKNDPLYSALIEDQETRERLMPHLFSCDVTECFETCEVYADSEELKGILIVSDESDHRHAFYNYFVSLKESLVTDGWLIHEDPSTKTFWNFMLGKDYLNSAWTAQLHQTRRLHVIYLAVDPEYQHHGLAEMMMQEVIDQGWDTYETYNNLVILNEKQGNLTEAQNALDTMKEQFGDDYNIEKRAAFLEIDKQEQKANKNRDYTAFAEYYEKEIGYHIPERTPFVGKNFNVTRAGIHADGLLKNEEIYNIFDTDKLLNRPVLVAVSNTSGLAGIAHWMNTYYRLKGDKAVDKKSPLVEEVKKWVDKEYETGRVTAITDSELEKVIKESSEKLGINF